MIKLIVSLLFLFGTVMAESMSYRIDGSNWYLVTPESLSVEMRYGFIHGKEQFNLDFPLIENTDSVITVRVQGEAGSEVFDPLLNKYEGTNDVNSDHFSELKGTIFIPQANLNIIGDYLYEDRYSQQFDLYQKQFLNRYGYALPNASFGLAEEMQFNANYKSQTSTVFFDALKYDRWGIIPSTSNYSYRLGTRIAGGASLDRKRVNILFSASGDRYVDQIGSEEELEYMEIDVRSAVSFSPSEKLSFSIGYDRDDHFVGKDFLYGKMRHRIAYFNYMVRGGGYFQGGGEGELAADLTLMESLKLSATVEGGVRDGEEKREWLGLDSRVSFFGAEERKLREKFAINYSNDKYVFPFKLKSQISADQYPRYERITTDSATTVEAYSSDEYTVFQWGLWGEIGFSGNCFGVTLEGMLNRNVLDNPVLYTPGIMRSTVRVGRNKPRSIHTTITWELKGAWEHTTLNETNEMMTQHGNVTSGVSFVVVVPVQSPFLRDRFLPTFVLGAGPMRFNKEQQQPEIFGGNPVGPEIYLQLSGDILFSGKR